MLAVPGLAIDNSCNASAEFTVNGDGERKRDIQLKKGEDKMQTGGLHKGTGIATASKQMFSDCDTLGNGNSPSDRPASSAYGSKKGPGSASISLTSSSFGTPLQKKSSPEYLATLLEEKRGLGTLPNSFNFKHLTRLVDDEIAKVRTEFIDSSDSSSAQSHNQTPVFLDSACARAHQAGGDATTPDRRVLVQQKVFVPVQQYPDYNFVGRILGPRGMTAKQLEEETGCRIMIRGRGSTRDEGGDSQKLSSTGSNPKEELHVLIQCEDYEAAAQEKVKHAVECIRLMLKPPPDGEDELKRQQLMQLAIINGTYRPTNSLKMTLQNQSVLSPLSLYGLPLSVSNGISGAGASLLTSQSSALAREANDFTKSMRMALNTAAGLHTNASQSNPLGAAIGNLYDSGVNGKDFAAKRFPKSTNIAVNPMAQFMVGGAQRSSLSLSTNPAAALNPNLVDPLLISNMWNPQLASAVLAGLANSPNPLVKEYYKQMLTSLDIGSSVMSNISGLSMPPNNTTIAQTPTANSSVKPMNLQGYLTASSILNDAPPVMMQHNDGIAAAAARRQQQQTNKFFN